MPATGVARDPLVLVHYMAWYESKPASGAWGWHWTMGHFDPEVTGGDGRRQIASHDGPLIGPYDSGDDDALECQVLLMKLAGIDGVVVDWYGTSDFRDYAMIHRNTQRLIGRVKQAGLKFAICYEDQSIKHMVEAGRVTAAGGIDEAAKAMKWLDQHCFRDEAYVTLSGRPVLMVFGPQHFTAPQWPEVLAGVDHRPKLFGLPHLARETGMDGAFGWPPVSGGSEIPRETWLDYLKDLHSRETVISVAFPGYHDIYQEAGLHDRYGFIDAREGKTFGETLALARDSAAAIIQIATWNDYGEGTGIEPADKSGFRYLEVVQDSFGSGASAADLRLPVLLYQLRKSHGGDPLLAAKLESASKLLHAGKTADARKLLEAVRAGVPAE